MKRQLDLEHLTLKSGAHPAGGADMCVMEAVAYMAGESWSDTPACASPVVALFCRTWNDTDEPYGQAIRDRLRGYIPRLVDSRGTAQQEERRSWLALDWLIRVHTATWLRVAGLTEHARHLLRRVQFRQSRRRGSHALDPALRHRGDTAAARLRALLKANALSVRTGEGMDRAATWCRLTDPYRSALPLPLRQCPPAWRRPSPPATAPLRRRSAGCRGAAFSRRRADPCP